MIVPHCCPTVKRNGVEKFVDYDVMAGEARPSLRLQKNQAWLRIISCEWSSRKTQNDSNRMNFWRGTSLPGSGWPATITAYESTLYANGFPAILEDQIFAGRGFPLSINSHTCHLWWGVPICSIDQQENRPMGFLTELLSPLSLNMSFPSTWWGLLVHWNHHQISSSPWGYLKSHNLPWSL